MFMILPDLGELTTWGDSNQYGQNVPRGPVAPSSTSNPLAILVLYDYDTDGDAHISCTEAREHGIAPVYSDHPAYRYMTDRNQDEVACE